MSGRVSSWDEDFSDRYDEWFGTDGPDIEFYVDLARTVDGPLVELAVGNGRVAIPVALATGRSVIGWDTSPSMLRQAQQRAEQTGAILDLRHGDMRDFAVDEPAGLVYCPARSLLHLPTWQDRRRTFERVAAALRPGGIFAWNAFAFDHHLAATLDGVHQDAPVIHTVTYDVADNRVDLTMESRSRRSLWWATKNEWLGLIDIAGLHLEELAGGFRREPLDASAREYVFVTRRPLGGAPEDGSGAVD
jgi:SAM-dependent methyltransferase